MLICGVEEAGRGPVIGPLVMAGVLVKKEDEAKLKAIGAKDSKLLSPMQREDLFDKIIELAEKHKIIIVQPKEVDDALNSEELNLNWLEAEKSAEIINELNPDSAMLDAPSNNIQAYIDYVKNKITTKTIIKAEHKADLNYPVVSAASILAKVTRDREIKKIQAEVKEPLGSGYPSDPKTKEFLKNNYNKYPDIFRKTWASYKNVANKKNQTRLGSF